VAPSSRRGKRLSYGNRLFSAVAMPEKPLLDPAVAPRYNETVLALGASKPAEFLQNFLGRPFNVAA